MRPDIRYEILMPVRRPSALLTAVQFLSAVLIAVILVPAGAHLFALPNKLALAPSDYMAAQQAYRGWALFGIPIVLTLVATGVQTILLRRHGAACLWSLASFFLIAASQAVFWVYTFPVNRITRDWAVSPDSFESLRLRWEYSHALGAALVFLAFIAAMLSILTSRSFALLPSRDHKA